MMAGALHYLYYLLHATRKSGHRDSVEIYLGVSGVFRVRVVRGGNPLTAVYSSSLEDAIREVTIEYNKLRQADPGG